MSARRSGIAANKWILQSVKTPKFVYRYGIDTDATVRDLERKVNPIVSAAKYETLLNNYGLMVIYEWFHPNEYVLDKDYYWREYVRMISHSMPSDKSLPTVFVADDVNHEGMKECLGTSIVCKSCEIRCSFHNLSKPSSVGNLIKAITRKTNSMLKLHSLALRIRSNSDDSTNGFVSSLQPLLEESMTMYHNIHYEKLLQIARKSRRGDKAKELLTLLADNGLSSPKLVRNNSFLLFTKGK